MHRDSVYLQTLFKRVPVVLSALCLALSLPGVASAQPRAHGGDLAANAGPGAIYSVVARSGVNVRSGPSLRYRRLGALPKGTEVLLIEVTSARRWKVTGRGLTGWVPSAYLRLARGVRVATPIRPGTSRGLAGALEAPGARSGRSGSPPRPATRSSSVAASSRGTGRIDRRNLAGLDPRLRRKVENILRRLQAKGWQPYVADGRRTRAQQRRKVALGYSKTMRSRHLTGNAADIVDRRYGWRGPARSTRFRFWRDLGAAAAAEGLTWGGNWRSFKDVAHVQR